MRDKRRRMRGNKRQETFLIDGLKWIIDRKKWIVDDG
jgi:hypothetical protein